MSNEMQHSWKDHIGSWFDSLNGGPDVAAQETENKTASAHSTVDLDYSTKVANATRDVADLLEGLALSSSEKGASAENDELGAAIVDQEHADLVAEFRSKLAAAEAGEAPARTSDETVPDVSGPALTNEGLMSLTRRQANKNMAEDLRKHLGMTPRMGAGLDAIADSGKGRSDTKYAEMSFEQALASIAAKKGGQ